MLLFDATGKDLCVEKQEYADHLVILIWRCAQLKMRQRYLTRARILLKNDAIAKKTTLFNKVGLYENVKTPQIRFLQLKFSRYCLIQRNKVPKNASHCHQPQSACNFGFDDIWLVEFPYKKLYYSA